MGNNPLRVTLTRSGLEARHARTLVADACEGLPEELVDRARLLTSEVVTNALQYGMGEIELRVQASPDRVRVEVMDQNPEEPHLLPLDPARPGGNGMRIVESLAHQWGVTQFPHTKSVWFVVR